MQPLYIIANQYRDALETLAELEPDDTAISDTLEGLQGEFEDKAVSVAAYIRNIEALAESIKQAEKEMADRRKKLESKAERIREYLKQQIMLVNVGNKIEAPWFTLSLRKNPPKVVIDNESFIPAEFMSQPEPPPPSPDKKAIAAALNEGKIVEGAHIEQSTRLEIK